jgi:hypothetical protein
MIRCVISIMFAACLTLNSFSVVRADRRKQEQNQRASFPPNLILSGEAKKLRACGKC